MDDGSGRGGVTSQLPREGVPNSYYRVMASANVLASATSWRESAYVLPAQGVIATLRRVSLMVTSIRGSVEAGR